VEIELDNVLTILNTSEIKDLDLTKQLGFEIFWNNNGAYQCKPHMLHNDRCEMLHALVFNLGFIDKCVIIPCTKLPTLCIEDSSKSEFWGTIIAKFYDPHEGIDMFLVFLFAPWR